MTRILPQPPPGLPVAVRAAVQHFPAHEPRIGLWWRDYPYISEEEDLATEHWAAPQASRAFTEFLFAEFGITATTVYACDADLAFTDEHWWVRIATPDGVLNVDWTARQFYNLQHPPAPEHADLPCPLVWMTSDDHPDDHHPVIGHYGTVTETPYTPESNQEVTPPN